MVQPQGAASIAEKMKTPQYFLDKSEMQKLVKQSLSQIEFRDFEGATEAVNECSSIAAKYLAQPCAYSFTKYQQKP